MEDIELKSLAGFKRALARPGAMVQIIEHSFAETRKPKSDPFWQPRKVVRLLAGSAAFEMPEGRASWLQFGKASNWSFEGNRAKMNDDGLRIVYVVT